MKKSIYSLFSIALLSVTMTACSGNTANQSSDDPAANASSGNTAKTITFWYNNSGEEAKVYEEAVKAFNESQDEYKVEGLSVTDAQKLIVAMSSNESPDVIKISNQSVIQYQANRLLENLQPFMDKENFDTSIYSAQSMAANVADGNTYALPLSAYTIQMFYNKDLLEAAGYTEPPKTMEELYEMAVAATVISADGNIDIMGYPLFPLASARQELIYAFGGRWWDVDSNVTPDNPSNIASLKMNVDYRNQYGIDKVNTFVATANTNRYTEQDMFFAGKQLFRFDGAWLPTMMETFNSDVNWGISYIPGTQADPNLIGSSRFETSSVSIPVGAKDKDGAWTFVKWLCARDGSDIINIGTGNLPAITECYTAPEYLAVPGFPEFMQALELEKGVQYPNMKGFDEYISLINTALDEVYSGAKTPEQGLADLKKSAEALQ